MAAHRLFLFLALVIVVSAGSRKRSPRRERVDELKCVKVTLSGDEHKTVYDDDGKPVKIKSVTVVHQTSSVKCREHHNYFYHGSELSTKNGCCATFKVCFKVTVCKTKCRAPSKSTKKLRHPKTKKCTKCSKRIRYTKVSRSHKKSKSPKWSKKTKKWNKSKKSKKSKSPKWTKSYKWSPKSSKKYSKKSRLSKIRIQKGCKEISLLSRINRPIFTTISGGDVRSIKLVKEFHDSLGCTYDVTYGCKKGQEVYAKKGCRGRFRVCVS